MAERKQSGGNLSLLWVYMRRHSRQYGVGMVLVLVSAAAALLPFYFIRLVVDGLTAALAGEAGGITLGTAGLYSLGIVLSSLFSGSLLLVMRRLIIVASREIEYEVRRDLFAHLQTLDKAYFDRSRTGDLMNRLTGDLSSVRDMLGFGAWQIVNIIATFTASLAVMFSLSLPLTGVVLVSLPIMTGTFMVLARLIHARHTEVQEQNSRIAAKAQENFSGARVVKGYVMEERELESYRELNLELLRRNIRLTQVDGPLRAFASLLLGLVFGAVLLVGGRQILLGGGLSVGEFVQFIGTLGQLAFPMLMAGWITSVVQRGVASWSRLVELWEARPEVARVTEMRARAAGTTPITGHLSFEGVSLSIGGTDILRGIDLDIPAGTFLGITGPTGSGKTALVGLMTRQTDPTSGRVLLDGRDLREISTRRLRDSIGIVPQEPFLFSDTLANNITFGLETEELPDIPTALNVNDVPRPPLHPQQPDAARVQRASELAGLAGDVEGFSEGYETLLGERGVTLSGGQRQRTAIARAIAREPRILILDDSLSAVDTETERHIMEGLREVSKGRTVILVAHRISTLRYADDIVVLEGGRITERGSHEQLLELGGHYAELDRLQQLAGELESEPDGEPKSAAESSPQVAGGAAAAHDFPVFELELAPAKADAEAGAGATHTERGDA